jgi:excisionase family DNA binding protein
VPETALAAHRDSLTFGRPPHRQLWRGYAALMAGGEALPVVVVGGAGRNRRGRSRRGRHFGGMEQTRAELFARRRHLGGMARKSAAPTFFTERTLADFLAVSDRTVRNWIRRGELPSYKLGAARRIDPADVEDFLARHRDEAS